jgi:hypothetical protein
MRWRAAVVAVVAVVSALALPIDVASATSTTVLRLDGMGPLHLGMTRSHGLATGWLAGRATGCELAGPPLPITYRFTGAKAPRGIVGVAHFDGNRLSVLFFARSVRTSTGVHRNFAAGQAARFADGEGDWDRRSHRQRPPRLARLLAMFAVRTRYERLASETASPRAGGVRAVEHASIPTLRVGPVDRDASLEELAVEDRAPIGQPEGAHPRTANMSL